MPNPRLNEMQGAGMTRVRWTMILDLFRNRSNRPVINRLHGEIVAVARHPRFYETCGVADTFEGRFELLTLHAVLVLRRLRAMPAPGPDLAQDLTDAIFAHLDIALREIGVGDLSVPKRMKSLAAAFLGRAAAYDAPLARRDPEALAVVLGRNVFGAGDAMDGTALGNAERLARHVLRLDSDLAKLTTDDFVRGTFEFRHPDIIPA